MNVRALVVVALIIAVGSAYYYSRSAESEQPVAAQTAPALQQETKSEPIEPSKPAKAAGAPVTTTIPGTPAPTPPPTSKTVREITPTREELKRQVTADPHETPEALLK